MATSKSIFSTIAILLPVLVLGAVAIQSGSGSNQAPSPASRIRAGVPKAPKRLVRAGTLEDDEVIQTISTGEEIDFESYLAENEWVVFAFLGDWSDRSSEVARKLEDLAMARRNTSILLIQADSWDCPAFKQADIKQVPTLWIYKGQKRLSDNAAQVIEMVRSH